MGLVRDCHAACVSPHASWYVIAVLHAFRRMPHQSSCLPNRRFVTDEKPKAAKNKTENCKKCSGSGAVDCRVCGGSGVDKKNGNLLERNKVPFRLTSPHLTSPHLTSDLTSPHHLTHHHLTRLTSPHYTSPTSA